MKKIILYGCGAYYGQYKSLLPADMEAVAFADGAMEKQTSATGNTFEGKPVLSVEELSHEEFDLVYICTDFKNANEICRDLVKHGIGTDKIRMLCREACGIGWKYGPTADKKAFLSDIGGIKIQERHRTDFDIVTEIYVENAYEMKLPFDRYCVVDMGMNIGAATLFFAGKKEVEKVYSYEPFPDTYQQAMGNISLNPALAKKITAHNFGLLDGDRKMEVALCTEETGWRNVFATGGSDRKVEIECRDAAAELERVIAECGGARLVLKVDVEGSEFAIFDSLARKTLFEKIDAVVMEYHGDRELLAGRLAENGFKIFMPGRKTFGILYAVK